MTRVLRTLMVATLVAVPLRAQDPVIAARMANVGGKSEPKACKLDPGHFLVSSGATYLQQALATTVSENRVRLLRSGADVLRQAITQKGQDKNPAAWYYLGRVDLLRGDFPAADSALKTLVALRPDCGAEVDNVRADARAVLVAADSFKKAGKTDSALYLFRAGFSIYPTSAFAAYEIAEILKGAGQVDSATTYYEWAVLAAHDDTPNSRAIRGNAAFTLGTIYYNAKKFGDAVRTFRIALQANPKDEDARKDLAISFRAAGMPDSARALDEAALKAAQASGSMTPDQTFDLGVAQFNDQKFADAVASFRSVLAAQPYRHDALANLANSYSAMDSVQAALDQARAWVDLEPLSFRAIALVAKETKALEDRQKSKQKPKTFAAFSRLFAMTVSLDPEGLTVAGTTATLKFTAKGRAGTDASGKTLPPAGASIVVEFLDAKGAVVATQTASVPALAPDATQELTVATTGQGIVGWRYHKA